MHHKHVTLKEEVCGWNMWKTNVKHTFIAVILSVGRWGANLLENQTLRVFFFKFCGIGRSFFQDISSQQDR